MMAGFINLACAGCGSALDHQSIQSGVALTLAAALHKQKGQSHRIHDWPINSEKFSRPKTISAVTSVAVQP